jgi:hypothetical protein
MSNLETEVQALKDEVKQLMSEVHTLQRQQASRKGESGARGEKGEPGRSAVVKIVQANGKVLIVDVDGKVHAELVPVAGQNGRDGRDGVSPNMQQVINGVLEEFGRRIDASLARDRAAQ